MMTGIVMTGRTGGAGRLRGALPFRDQRGMRKRAGLARAMALDPAILYLDEPSAGLDPLSSRRLDDLILEQRESAGTTIVLVTHEFPSIFALGDNAVFLDGERKAMIAQGKPSDCESTRSRRCGRSRRPALRFRASQPRRRARGGTSCARRSRRRASADRRGPRGEPRPRLWRRRRGGGARCAAQHAGVAHPPPRDRQARLPPPRLRPASCQALTGSKAGGRRASANSTTTERAPAR